MCPQQDPSHRRHSLANQSPSQSKWTCPIGAQHKWITPAFRSLFSHLKWKGRTAVKITLGALDSVQNSGRLPVLLRWSPVSPRQFNNHSLCYNNMAYFGMEGFNFPGSVHHLLGRLRPCAELIGGRVQLPTRWLELLLMSPFARSQRHSGGTNGWVLRRAGCRGQAHMLAPRPQPHHHRHPQTTSHAGASVWWSEAAQAHISQWVDQSGRQVFERVSPGGCELNTGARVGCLGDQPEINMGVLTVNHCLKGWAWEIIVCSRLWTVKLWIQHPSGTLEKSLGMGLLFIGSGLQVPPQERERRVV